eukprot:6446451-Prymnesium_polylepis.1
MASKMSSAQSKGKRRVPLGECAQADRAAAQAGAISRKPQRSTSHVANGGGLVARDQKSAA